DGHPNVTSTGPPGTPQDNGMLVPVQPQLPLLPSAVSLLKLKPQYESLQATMHDVEDAASNLESTSAKESEVYSDEDDDRMLKIPGTVEYKKQKMGQNAVFHDLVTTFCFKLLGSGRGEEDRVRLWVTIARSTLLPPPRIATLTLGDLRLVQANFGLRSTSAEEVRKSNVNAMLLQCPVENSTGETINIYYPMLRHPDPLLCPMNALAMLLFHWMEIHTANQSVPSNDEWMNMSVFPKSQCTDEDFISGAWTATSSQELASCPNIDYKLSTDYPFERDWAIAQGLLPEESRFSYHHVIAMYKLWTLRSHHAFARIKGLDLPVSESCYHEVNRLFKKHTGSTHSSKKARKNPEVSGGAEDNAALAFDARLVVKLSQRVKNHVSDAAVRRSLVKPPRNLTRQIFPWIETLVKQAPPLEPEFELSDEQMRFFQHIDLLRELRMVLLQDFAVILSDLNMQELRQHPVFMHPIFKSRSFKHFQVRVLKNLAGLDSHRKDVREIDEESNRTIMGFEQVDSEDEEEEGDMDTERIEEGELEEVVTMQVEKDVGGELEEGEVVTTVLASGMKPNLARNTVGNPKASLSAVKQRNDTERRIALLLGRTAKVEQSIRRPLTSTPPQSGPFDQASVSAGSLAGATTAASDDSDAPVSDIVNGGATVEMNTQKSLPLAGACAHEKHGAEKCTVSIMDANSNEDGALVDTSV
ncbi:hypothetical protein EV182_001130, partial [Spiromyces aspiralis]